ncbi:MAG: hypothetical protein LBJ89_03045 [Holosporales bacterium]|jgi:hypothetical protein|nr:hypothetical protein [Holosporales bacterium]
MLYNYYGSLIKKVCCAFGLTIAGVEGIIANTEVALVSDKTSDTRFIRRSPSCPANLSRAKNDEHNIPAVEIFNTITIPTLMAKQKELMIISEYVNTINMLRKAERAREDQQRRINEFKANKAQFTRSIPHRKGSGKRSWQVKHRQMNNELLNLERQCDTLREKLERECLLACKCSQSLQFGGTSMVVLFQYAPEQPLPIESEYEQEGGVLYTVEGCPDIKKSKDLALLLDQCKIDTIRSLTFEDQEIDDRFMWLWNILFRDCTLDSLSFTGCRFLDPGAYGVLYDRRIGSLTIRGCGLAAEQASIFSHYDSFGTTVKIGD